MNTDSKNRDDLSQRISRAEAEAEANTTVADPGDNLTRNVGVDFISTVVGAGIVGAVLDYFLKTSPWFLLGMIFVGFAFGLRGAWRAMQSPKTKE